MMLPTPVVFEYLIPFGQQERTKQLEILERHFIMPPFDLRTSLIAQRRGTEQADCQDRQQILFHLISH